MDLDDYKTNDNTRAPGMADIAAVYKFPEKKWVQIRLLPGMQPEACYWVTTKKKDGKIAKFMAPCVSYDPAAQERDSTIYDPWRDLQLKEASLIKAGDMAKEEAKVQYASHFWMQAVVRSEQKKQPSKLPKPSKEERSSGFKSKDSDSWTPVYVVKVGRGLAGKLKELKGLNTVESKKTGSIQAFAVNDAKYGRDIRVLYDSSKAPADQYQVQLGEKRTPLTDEELEYLKWDMEGIVIEADPKAVKADYESWASRNGIKTKKGKQVDDEDDAEDDEDADEKPAKKSKGKPSKKAKDEDFDDDDFDDEDDDDDEDEKPAKKSKGKPAKKSKNDFDDEDDDFDDEDEDEKPAKKSKGKPAKKAKDDFDDEDEDDDLDLDDEDEDEDEDEKPAKKSKGKPSKKAKDEDDDFDDFDDEDEDEKPAKKSVKKKKSK